MSHISLPVREAAHCSRERLIQFLGQCGLRSGCWLVVLGFGLRASAGRVAANGFPPFESESPYQNRTFRTRA